jgi:CubicO group peptidase (beta-lactamase class C family)
MKRIGELCIVGLLLLVLASCSTMLGRNDDPFAQTKEVAREIGNSLVTGQGDVSALSIAIMHQGQIIHSEGFGMRDVAMGLPVEPDTRFNIGSISKVFTAAAILLLQEEGLLNLDDKVTDARRFHR